MTKINASLLVIATALISHAAGAADVAQKSKTIPDVVKAETHDQKKPSMGFFGGYAATESRREATSFGVDYTIQPTIPFAVGAEVVGYVSHETKGRAALTRTRVLAKGTYNFGGTFPIIKNSYVGLGIGPVIDNESHRVTVSLGVVPNVGFDIPLSNFFANWSVGANAGYMLLTAGDQAFVANGVLKYWF